MKTIAIAATALLLSGLLAAQAAEPEKRDVVAFSATVRVDVDTAGAPVKVEAPADLPAAIRAYVEQRVASWQYLPARQDGVAVPATTYVRVGACALPDEASGGYQLGVDFKGNGPGLMSESGRLDPPGYPRHALMRGDTGVFRVVYSINGSGKPKVDVITPLGDEPPRGFKAFQAALEKWVGGLPYQPEIVNGQPVATQISTIVEFRLSDDYGTPVWRKQYLEDLKSKAISSSECTLASGASFGLQPVAIDSPVKVIPTPAG